MVDQKLHSLVKSGIILDNSSDHLPCYCLIQDLNPHHMEDLEITSRDTRKKNLDTLKRKLTETDILLPLHDQPIDSQFEEFHSKLGDLIDQYLPVRTRQIPHKRKRKEPWVTAGVPISINRSKKLYKKFIKDQVKVKSERYHNYNVQLKRIKQTAKKMYYAETCEQNRINNRKLWMIINHAIHRSNNKSGVIEKLKIGRVEEYRGQLIVEEFARYFSTIGKTFANKMPASKKTITEYLSTIPNHNRSIFLEPCTEQEIKQTDTKSPTKKE